MPAPISITADSANELLGRFGFDEEPAEQPAVEKQNGHQHEPFSVPEFLQRHHLAVKDTKQRGGTTIYVLEECPFNPDHKGKDAAVTVRAGGEIGFKCFHESCAGNKWKTLRLKFEPDAYSKKRKARAIVVSEPAATDLRSPSGRTDRANALRFVSLFGQDVRWCDPWSKWLVWDGKRWETDSQRKIESLAKKVADLIWREVGGLLPTLDGPTSTEVTRFARSTSNTRGINDMLASARSEPGIAVLPQHLDAQPWLFNCINVTVDLRTGQGMPHDRRHNLTKICPHHYSDVTATLWAATLNKIFADNEALNGFFRRLCGSAMVGEVIEHILPIPWGSGSNGKSLTLETIMEAMGPDYAAKGASDLLLASNGDRHPTEKADLHGKRLIVCTETEDGRRLAEGVVKELTGGDTVKARRMREDFWEFAPSHTLFLVTNHKPIVKGTDHGTWRRLRLLPFTQRFWDRGKDEAGPAELEADSRLKKKLRAELPGIVRWLVDACLEWQRDGLGQPTEVTVATAEYRTAMDTLAEFVSECCSLESSVTVKASDVRKRYAEWCKENNERAVSGRRLGEYLRNRGIEKQISNGTWYRGLTLQ